MACADVRAAGNLFLKINFTGKNISATVTNVTKKFRITTGKTQNLLIDFRCRNDNCIVYQISYTDIQDFG